MSPYFCWSLLSFSLKTAGMKSERRNSSAIMAFPLETILRMAWPHRLFSAKKSTIAAGGRRRMTLCLCSRLTASILQLKKNTFRNESELRVKVQFRFLFYFQLQRFIRPVAGEQDIECLSSPRLVLSSNSFQMDLGNSLLHQCYLYLANEYYNESTLQENAGFLTGNTVCHTFKMLNR